VKTAEEMIREMVRRCEYCVVDLDQCIYPRFTQTTLGRLLLIRSLNPRYWRFLPRLLAGAGYISWTRSAQLWGRHATNHELMTAFCQVITGFPLKLVEELSLRMPGMGPQTWREALCKISLQMDVYLLTFSIEPLARAYGMAQDKRGRRIFKGWRGTPLEDNGGVITCADFSPYTLSAPAKLETLENLMRDRGFNHPLIIGHGEDEAGMAVRARKLGGGSIGLIKPGDNVEDFELQLPGDAWRSIASALKEE